MLLTALLKPAAYLSLPVLLVRALAQRSPLARYYVRIGVYVSAVGLCSVWGVIVAVGMSLAGARFNTNWVVARSFYALAGGALDITFDVEGEEHLDVRPSVLLGNHQSMLDVLYLGRIFPQRAAIMAKKELQWTPLLGQYMSLSGAVFVDRGNNARAVQSLRAAGELMKARETSLWMFPEGTRSMAEAPHLLSFKKGAFHLAVQAGVPIVPVVCENYWRLYRKGVFDSGVLKIKVLPPIPTADLTADDIPDLVNRVRDQMLAALIEISAPAASPSSSTPTPPAETPKTVLDQRVPTVPGALPSDSESPRGTPVPALPSGAAPTAEAAARAAMPAPALPERGRELSRESVASSSGSSARRRAESETGADTEEDEGMVLVGRPQPSGSR